MSELDLALLGSRIRAVRKDRGVTQQELAHQTGLPVKTVRDIERGRKNPSYETVIRLLNRLGISPDTVFHSGKPAPSEEMQLILESFQSCDPKVQKVLLKIVRLLTEQLRTSLEDPDGLFS